MIEVIIFLTWRMCPHIHQDFLQTATADADETLTSYDT